MTRSRKLALAVIVPAVVFAAMQLVPYGRDHAPPADGQLAVFDSPRTEDLARRACFDCHSNRTRWPAYASIAPVSWRIQNHVDEGREALNFSALDTTSEKGAEAAGESGDEIREGKMPPLDYLLMHPEARLSKSEKADLARGLDVTFAALSEGGEGARGGKSARAESNAREEEKERDDADRD